MEVFDLTEIMNRYGRVGEIFYALLEIAPSDEIRDTLTEFAFGVYTDQTEEDATSIEAEVVRAILASKDKATPDQRLAIQTIVEEVNFDRSEKEKLAPRSIGWVTTRLGFKKRRMPDKKGSRAILLDSDLLQNLTEAYDIEQPTQVAVSPLSPPERQTVRKEGLFTFISSDSDVLGSTEKEPLGIVRTEDSALNSDRSVNLTVRGGDVSSEVLGQVACIRLVSGRPCKIVFPDEPSFRNHLETYKHDGALRP